MTGNATIRYTNTAVLSVRAVDAPIVVTSDDFDRILRDTVAATYPAHEQDAFLEHFRGLLGMWASDRMAASS